MSKSSRINDAARWDWGASNQGMYSLLVFWIWSSFLLSCAIRSGDAVILQELVQHVNFLLHTRALRMISLTTVCVLAHFSFVLLLLEVLVGAWGLLLRLGIVSLLFRWILWIGFLLSFGIHLQISNKQCLVFGRFGGAHHYQFILLLNEGFNEVSKIRHLLG